MSVHRQHYVPENPTPIEQVPIGQPNDLLMVAALASAAMAIGLAIAMALHTPRATVTTVRTPDVQIVPLEPIDGQRLTEIRAEAFRAGYANAVHDGCRLPALATPIAEVRP